MRTELRTTAHRPLMHLTPGRHQRHDDGWSRLLEVIRDTIGNPWVWIVAVLAVLVMLRSHGDPLASRERTVGTAVRELRISDAIHQSDARDTRFPRARTSADPERTSP